MREVHAEPRAQGMWGGGAGGLSCLTEIINITTVSQRGISKVNASERYPGSVGPAGGLTAWLGTGSTRTSPPALRL